ncbi:MAG: carboxy terminal-processing peptidase [Bacteroidota bacterium]
MYFQRNKIFTSITILSALILFSFQTADDDDEKNKVLIDLIIQGLSRSHYQSVEIDDAFSEKAFDLYLKRIDYNKRFLTQQDIERLKKYRHQIDDELKTRTYTFYDLSIEIIDNRINEAEVYYKDILSKPFDFEKDEFIELDAEKMPYAANEEELKESWRKSLKYQTLSKLADLMQVQEKAREDNDTTVIIKTFQELNEEAGKKILKRHDEWFNRMSKIEKSDRLTVYINSIVNIYDPHSAYFPPEDKENFDIYMSGRLEGIGAQLQEKDGYITVSRIVPGSACWRQGQLKAKDIILNVGQGNEEPVDVVDMRLDNAVKLIRGKKGTEVRLTVKKLDGNIIVIPIIRDVVELEETYAKSAIIKNDISIGYIKLPKFYADFNKKGGRNCAGDVKKELAKLKQENIDGIILDLRDNGGGSLHDAVDIAGLFIKKGPIVQIRSRFGEPYILEDKDTAVQYNGALVIMVNSFSVSASEIFAAAMQDYNRGVVIGSSTTFGKGTVQRFFNLDNFLSGDAGNIKPLGSIKLTTQKFYRIDGSSTQLKGVTPDIILPDNYTYIEIGEKEHEYPLTWDKISPVQYELCNSSFYDINTIRENSSQMIHSLATFELIEENAGLLKRLRDKTIYSLNLEKYREEQKKVKEEAKKYDDLNKEIPGLNIFSLKSDIPAIEADSAKTERTSEWHKNLKKDVYLFEAVGVIEGMR